MTDANFSAPDDAFDLLAIWRVAWERKLFIILFTTVCVAIAVVLALTAKQVFRAEAVAVQASDSGMSGAAGLANQLGGLANLVGVNLGASGDDESRESLALLRSRLLAEAFVKRYELVSAMFADSTKPPTLWKAVQRFRQGVLVVREDKRTGTIAVIVDWEDPQVAARWANDFIALANELRRTQVVEEAKRNIDYLEQQIARTDIVEMRRVMYNLIEVETKKLMLANARADYAFAVVDPAVAPEVRIAPKRTVMVLVGAFIGGVCAVMLAFAHSRYMLYRRRPVGGATS